MSKVIKLKEIANIITGFPFKGEQYSDVGIKTVRGENVTEGNLRWDTIKCWPHKFDKEEEYLLKEDDVVIGMDGSKVGKNKARIRKRDLPLLLAQRVACVRAKEKNNQLFLFYLINNPRFELYVLKTQTGSSVPHISKSQIEDFEIPQFNSANQQKIAAVLSSLDDKIELNKQINAELEQLAKTLYDYWFVQFEFPDKNGKPYKSYGGKMVWNAVLKREIPEGWEVKKLKQIAKTGSGGTPKSTKKNYYYPGTIPWINSGELNNPFIVETNNFISEEGMQNSSAKFFPSNSILMAMYGATAGKTSIISFEATSNQAICSIIPNNKTMLLYIKLALNDMYQYLLNLSTGSARDNLSQDKIKELNIIIPDANLLTQFSEITTNNFEKIKNTSIQNQQLASLRDWLLPLLMNGQVTVADAEEQVKAVVKETQAAKPKNDSYAKIQLLYAIISANKEIGVKQGEMATAKDVYLLDRMYGIPTGFQFAQHNWGSFDPEEKRLLNTKQYFHKPNFPNSKAVYLDLKDEGKLLDKIPHTLKEQVSHAIQEMNAKVFNRYFGTQKAEKKELFATVLKCIEDRQSLDLAIIRDEMTNWKIKQGEKASTKAEKFTEAETREALEIIVHEKWFERVMRE